MDGLPGFSVHAGVGIRAHDRKGPERLCKYASRPPLATERLARLGEVDTGRRAYRWNHKGMSAR